MLDELMAELPDDAKVALAKELSARLARYARKQGGESECPACRRAWEGELPERPEPGFDALEHVLDYYFERQRLRWEHDSLDYKMASAAAQIVFRLWPKDYPNEGERLAALKDALEYFATVRNQHVGVHPWPLRGSIDDKVRRVAQVLSPRRGRRPSETRQQQRVFYILAEGIHSEPQRSGVSAARQALLELAASAWLEEDDDDSIVR